MVSTYRVYVPENLLHNPYWRRILGVIPQCSILALCSLLSLLPPSYAHGEPVPIAWERVGDGMEISTATVYTKGLFPSRLTLVRATPSLYRLTVVRTTEFNQRKWDARSLCRESRAALCINASFFDEQWKPLGLIIERGITLQKMHRGGNTLTGVLFATRNEIGISHRLDFRPERTLEAVQAGPRLIANGQPVQGLRESSSTTRRSGACVDLEKRLIFFTVESSIVGMPIEQLQNTLLQRDIACWEALNLDGGGSTQLYLSPALPGATSAAREIFVEGEDDVPAFLTLQPSSINAE